jgi:VanZ family protein
MLVRMRNLRFKIIHWVPVVVWMTLIFTGSGDPLSFQHSSTFLEPLLRWLLPWLSDTGVHNAMLFVRKCGHIAEYAVLAVLLWHAVRKTATAPQRWYWPHARAAFLLACVYAATDELHQVLVPSRQGAFVDVLVDAVGAALGLLLVSCAVALRQPRPALPSPAVAPR